jgi:hypothetical protein
MNEELRYEREVWEKLREEWPLLMNLKFPLKKVTELLQREALPDSTHSKLHQLYLTTIADDPNYTSVRCP